MEESFLHLEEWVGDGLKEEKIIALLSKDLLAELDILVDFVVRMCEAPESLHLKRNNLVYEVVRLVGEDYRLVQLEICLRVTELGDRVPSLSPGELTQLLGTLRKLESCKERLFLVLGNRKRNDELWELMKETKVKTIETIEKETKALVKIRNTNVSQEFSYCRERFVELGQLGLFRSENKRSAMEVVSLTVY